MAEARIESGAARVRNSKQQHHKNQHDGQQQHQHKIVKRFLLLLVGSAVDHADGRRQVQVVDRLLDGFDRAAQIACLPGGR